ncbi:MAG: hypothetical protein J6J04_02470, partial [Oscillospiraceae bacterium]|nr:hypothetical protein [Oscillospiraceae bacterium]
PANAMDLQPAAAHALFFDEKQCARLQSDMYFSTRTCRVEKWIESYFVLADETLRGVFDKLRHLPVVSGGCFFGYGFG